MQKNNLDKRAENNWKNLAPNLIRQRAIIEATTPTIILPEMMKSYLVEMAEVADMQVLSGPYAYSAHEMGYGGWIHWKSSGAHVYSYPTEPPLLTVDIYTCKPFELNDVVEYTKQYFNTIEIIAKEV